MGAVNTQSQEYASMVSTLFAIGLEPIPIAPGKKYPTLDNWTTVDVGPIVENWPRNHGIGLRCGDILGLDIDIYHKDVVAVLWGHLLVDYPNMVGRVGQPPKVLIPFLCEDTKTKFTSSKLVDEHGVINQIEVLAKGQQFVAYGIHPGTRKPYTWTGDFLEHGLPEISLEEIHELFSLFDELATGKGWVNLDEKEKAAKFEFTSRPPSNIGTAPGDRYNRCCSITDVLTEYGWKHYRGPYWTRPGKKTGVSATVFNDEIVYIFTSSTSLEPNRTYDNFGLLAHYEYGNNFSAAAKGLLQIIKEAA